MYGGYFMASGTTSQENYSRLSHCEGPIAQGSKPYLPCLLSTCGSGNIIMKVNVLLVNIIFCEEIVEKLLHKQKTKSEENESQKRISAKSLKVFLPILQGMVPF